MRIKAKNISLCGMLFALAIAISYFESLIPSVGVPGVKLGLSNIVTMYALIVLGTPYALGVALAKSIFVLLTKGAVASFLSFAGGLSSIAVMRLLKKCDNTVIISIFGAVSHNAGQIAAAALIVKSLGVLWYLPILVMSGCIMGGITAFSLKMVMPYLKRERRACVKTSRNYYR